MFGKRSALTFLTLTTSLLVLAPPAHAKDYPIYGIPDAGSSGFCVEFTPFRPGLGVQVYKPDGVTYDNYYPLKPWRRGLLKAKLQTVGKSGPPIYLKYNSRRTVVWSGGVRKRVLPRITERQLFDYCPRF